MKRIEDINFDNDLFEDFTSDIATINSLCKELENDKSFQRMYKKYLKNKGKIKFEYNNIDYNLKGYNKRIANNSRMKISDNINCFEINEFNECFLGGFR